MLALQHWGSRWAELTPEHAHPGVVLWSWVAAYLRRDRLPQHRVLVRFDYPTLTGPGSRAWLLAERGDAEICEKHPGGDEELIIVVQRTVIGENHVHYLETCNALASSLGVDGRYSESTSEFTKLVHAATESLGCTHKRTLRYRTGRLIHKQRKRIVR
jgi:hypothetical protein